jgi:ketosteroid isomerase-like protein
VAEARSDNVELVRRIFEVFNRDGVEATAEWVADDLEVHPFPEWLGPSLYRGMEGLAEVVGEWTENFDDYRWEVERILPAPGDRVVILARQFGRTLDQGIEVSQVVSGVFWLRAGKVFRMRYFMTREEALTAGGLSPQA